MKTKSNNISIINYVSQTTAAIAKVDSTFPIDPASYTPNAKRHRIKPRKGSGPIISSLAQLVKTHNLDSPALHSATMLEQNDTAQALAPLVTSINKFLKLVEDAQYAASTQAWEMALQFYALLQRRAQTDGDIAAALQPITEFFSYRHQAVMAGKPTKLQTRANAKLRDAERLVSRTKSRASVIQEESTKPAATPAPAPVAVAPVAAAPSPAPIVINMPSPTPAPAPVVTYVPASNGVTNGASASNGVTNGVSNGALNGAADGH